MWKNITLERVGSNNRIFTARAIRKSFIPYIFFSSAIVCSALYYLEQEIGVNYAVKTGVKLFMFLLIPAVYFISTRDKNIYIKPPARYERKSFLTGVFSGLIFFTVLIIAYSILKSFIDFKPIINELETKLKITPLNFIFIGLYITLGNSFIEEFFFREFVFLGMYKAGRPLAAYLYSAILFALYHIMIFKNWFTPLLFLLSIFGLFAVGILFNWMDTKSRNFINSWIAHILADAAIILIGMKMFGIIKF